MGQFFFDVFDGTRAVRDDYGDVFAGVDDAADLAAGLLADFAREADTPGLSRDYGVIVRDRDGRDVYQAVMCFRAVFLDGRTPPGPADGIDPVPDPAELIRQSRATRAISRELRHWKHLRMAELSDALERTRRTAEELRRGRGCAA